MLSLIYYLISKTSISTVKNGFKSSILCSTCKASGSIKSNSSPFKSILFSLEGFSGTYSFFPAPFWIFKNISKWGLISVSMPLSFLITTNLYAILPSCSGFVMLSTTFLSFPAFRLPTLTSSSGVPELIFLMYQLTASFEEQFLISIFL